jgi:hypothetical protein
MSRRFWRSPGMLQRRLSVAIWKQATIVIERRPDAREARRDTTVQTPLERLGRFVEVLAKGALALTLYGSGTLVLSGILFYFSWKLGLAALLVLSGLLPLGASAYLLWRLLRGQRPPRLWRYKAREAAILQLAQHVGGRLTVAEVAMGTGLSLQAARATLNELVRKGYADLQVSPSGMLVYHCLPLSGAVDKERAERVWP